MKTLKIQEHRQRKPVRDLGMSKQSEWVPLNTTQTLSHFCYLQYQK